jgi:hypothetical protein
MKIINFFKLDENAEVLEKKEVAVNTNISIKAPSKEFIKKTDKNLEISGSWLVLDELLEIDNKFLVNFKNEEKSITWVRLPDKYVEENYMVDYDAEDQCPLGVDVLIKEDGYPIGVIKGCDSIKQAKVDNNLDGHRYKGELGITLNNKYFLTFKKEDEEFKVVKTNVDWDRGKHTI